MLIHKQMTRMSSYNSVNKTYKTANYVFAPSKVNKELLNQNHVEWIFPCLACTILNNAWNLVLWALPVSISLFKMNRLMYSPIISRFG